MKVWKGRDGNKPLKVRTLAAQSQTEGGSTMSSLLLTTSGFAQAFFSLASGGGARCFRWGTSKHPDAHIWMRCRQPRCTGRKACAAAAPTSKTCGPVWESRVISAIPGVGTDLL